MLPGAASGATATMLLGACSELARAGGCVLDTAVVQLLRDQLAQAAAQALSTALEGRLGRCGQHGWSTRVFMEFWLVYT